MNVSFEHHASFRERPSARRERRAGSRERHCLQSERFIRHPSLTSSITSLVSGTELSRNKNLQTSARSHLNIFRPIGHPTQHRKFTPSQDEQVEETIQCKYSEKESLQPKSSEFLLRERHRPHTTTQKVPAWLGDIDVHLDITPVDVISPFGSVLGAFDSSGNTYNNVPRVEMIYDESDDSYDNDENVCDQFLSDDEEKQRQSTNHKNLSKTSEPVARSSSPKSSRTTHSEKKLLQLMERPFSSRSTETHMSPRTSMMSPAIINKSQTAVDTRMPKTFQMALERKYLVESRLSESWDRSYESSSPGSNDNKSTTQSRHSKHNK
ncbi:hypothetical protein ACJMK2_015602 [Sinanodonta woodiana]|uniref:Uncharacterized protein n=1 Tax=Sinanodonta woodiana TaxID=1069815 RepID=A0ABD3URW8_SINWO